MSDIYFTLAVWGLVAFLAVALIVFVVANVSNNGLAVISIIERGGKMVIETKQLVTTAVAR